MTQIEALAWASELLDPRQAQWLMEGLGAWDWVTYRTRVERCVAGEPLAYVTGRWDFMGQPFEVTPDTLIPRADTEAWLDQVLRRDWPKTMKVCDVATGSGVIAITAKRCQPTWTVWATDCCPNALKVARRNAQHHDVHVHWRQAHWWPDTAAFDLILANPPYIALGDPHLSDLTHEPSLALVSGRDGLAACRVLIKEATAYLNPGGVMVLEHGFDQGESVAQLFRHAFCAHPEALYDLDGHWRATWAMKA